MANPTGQLGTVDSQPGFLEPSSAGAPTNVAIAIPLGELALTGFAPGFLNVSIEIPLGVLTLSAPTIAPRQRITIPLGVLALSAPTMTLGVAVDIPLGELILEGLAPDARQRRSIRIPLGVLTLKPLRPVVMFGGGPSGDGDPDDMVVFTPAGTGDPEYPWRLFKGQVIGVKLKRKGDHLALTLDVEDYNRLVPLFPIGQPLFGSAQPDGTNILGSAPFTAGDSPSSALMKYQFQLIWGGSGGLGISGPTLDYDAMVDEDPLGGGGEVQDWSTSGSDLKAFMDATSKQAGTYVRWWLTTMMELAIKKLAPVGEVSDTALIAPWSIDEDGPPSDGIVFPETIEPSWTFEKERSAIILRGGSPESQVPVANTGGPPYAGASPYDALGAVRYDDAFPIAQEVLAAIFRTFLAVSATIPPGHDGWRKGHTTFVTSERLSTGHGQSDARELLATSMIVMGFEGRLVGGGVGLTIRVDGDDISDLVTWRALTFAESLDGSAKATLVLEFADPSVSYHVRRLADVEIETAGLADIEYTLNLGDIEPGDIGKALAPPKPLAYQPPAYKFSISISDPDMPAPPGNVVSEEEPPLFYNALVIAQILDKDDKPFALSGVRLRWLLFDWADAGLSVPAYHDDLFGYHLADSVGITDDTGRAFTTLTRGRDPVENPPVAYEVRAVALPV